MSPPRATRWLWGAIATLGLASCGKAFTTASSSDDAGAGGNASGGVPASTGGTRATNNSGGAGGAATGGISSVMTGGAAGVGGTRASGGSGGEPIVPDASAAGGAIIGQSDAGPPVVEDAGPPIPTDGLLLWLRADRGVTVKNGTVTEWADQSPSKTNATQDLTNSQPRLLDDAIGGQPALVFDGQDDCLKLPAGFSDFTNGISIFAVAQTNSPDVCTGVFEASNGAEIDDISLDSDYGKLNFEVYESNDEEVSFPANAPEEIEAIQAPNQSVEVRRNGPMGIETAFPLPAEVVRNQIYVGKTLYANCGVFPGLIAEIIVYSRAVSLAEDAAIESYLQSKYACCTSS
ncbi:MAG TPA: hypothetical protein VH142_05325 [Polyangiaceae bacterium]|jgi:hypothetical protein|nr:hypothetical protein [Polyangiaceae bacterium]